MGSTANQERLASEIFGDWAAKKFDTASRGFVPLPILLRSLIRHLSLPELRTLIYLHLRANRHGYCFPTVSEIGADVGVNPKRLPAQLRSLTAKGFIEMSERRGRTYFLLLDPSLTVRRLVATGSIDEDELRAINELRELLGHAPIGAETGEDPCSSRFPSENVATRGAM